MKYDIQKVKRHIASLDDNKEKIKYLLEVKTDYLQSANNIEMAMQKAVYTKTFDEQCDLEIQKYKELEGLIVNPTELEPKPFFKLSEKNGAKTDLIRVLNALYELRLIEKTDGQLPTKKEYFKTIGACLGINLTSYHSNLSQALQNQPLEVNLKVFDDMKEAIKNAHSQTKTN